MCGAGSAMRLVGVMRSLDFQKAGRSAGNGPQIEQECPVGYGRPGERMIGSLRPIRRFAGHGANPGKRKQ